MVAEVADPDKITMMSIEDSPIGIQKMTGEILVVVRDLPSKMYD